MLQCLVDSNPLPYKIIWLRNQSEILHQNSTIVDLNIERVERNHSGIYTCLAFNRFHNNRTSNGSNDIELIVQSRPIIETTHSKLATELGQSLTLNCRVTGQPMPNIFWRSSEKIISCHDKMNNGICSLHFSKITSTDFGSYRCIAENLLGREEWVYTIVSRGKRKIFFLFLLQRIKF